MNCTIKSMVPGSEHTTSNLVNALANRKNFSRRRTDMSCREFVINHISEMMYTIYHARSFSDNIGIRNNSAVITVDHYGDRCKSIEKFIANGMFANTDEYKPIIKLSNGRYTVKFNIYVNKWSSSPGAISIVLFLLLHADELEEVCEKEGKDGIIKYILDEWESLFHRDPSYMYKYNAILTAFGIYAPLEYLTSWQDICYGLPSGIVTSYYQSPNLLNNGEARRLFVKFVTKFKVDVEPLDRNGLLISKMMKTFKEEKRW